MIVHYPRSAPALEDLKVRSAVSCRPCQLLIVSIQQYVVLRTGRRMELVQALKGTWVMRLHSI